MAHTSVSGTDAVRAFRARMKWSQSQLAAALDVRANTVSRWERGEVAVPHVVLLALRGLECEQAFSRDALDWSAVFSVVEPSSSTRVVYDEAEGRYRMVAATDRV